MDQFDDFVTGFLSDYWRLFPVESTQAGVHAHDARLTDISEHGHAEHARWRSSATRRLNAFNDHGLSASQRIDKRVALGELALQQIQLEWQYFRRAPALYIEEALNGVHFLLARPDAAASQAERDDNLIARVRGIPQLLSDGSTNIKAALVPPEFAEIAKTNVDGALRFVGGLALPQRPDAEPARRAALVALDEYRAFVRSLVPRGSFAVGRGLYDRLLQEHHGLALNADDVYATGERLSADLQVQMQALAAEIDPGQTWQHIVEAQKARHPAREALLQTYHDEMVRAREFVRAQRAG